MVTKSYSPTNGRLKVQFEDLANGPKAPGGWVYQTKSNGDNPGFEGSGYYYWKSESKVDYEKSPNQGVVTAKVYIADAGIYSLRLQGARDSNSPGDARNDVWLKIDGDTSNRLPKGEPAIKEVNGFAKFYKADKDWGYAYKLGTVKHMSADQRPDADFVLSKGFHTITFAGRAYGMHVDFFTLFKKGLNLSSSAPDSTSDTKLAGGSLEPTLDSPLNDPGDKPSVDGETSSRIKLASDDWETASGGKERGLDLGSEGSTKQNVGLRFTGLDLDEGATIESAYFVFTASKTSKGAANYDIEIENTLKAKTYTPANGPDDRTYRADGIDWNAGDWVKGEKYKSADFAAELNALIGKDGLDKSDALAFLISGSGERDAVANGATELVVTYDL